MLTQYWIPQEQEIDGRGERGGGGRGGGGGGVLRWLTVLMVPMKLGDVLCIDLEWDSLMKKKVVTDGPTDGQTLL